MEKAAIVALGRGSMPPYGRPFWAGGAAGLGGGAEIDDITPGLRVPACVA